MKTFGYAKDGKMSTEQKRGIMIAAVMITLLMIVCVMNVSLANNYVSTIKSLINNMVGIIGTIFQAVGVVLAVYSVGQLILAFKNEDADSKSRASTMMVVGVVLIALPGILKALNLTSMITGS